MATSSQTRQLCFLMMVLATFLATAGVCTAGSKPFKSHVEQGDKYVADTKYDQAIVEYQAAYALNPVPWLLINIGRAHFRADRPREALDYYNQALKTDLVQQDREAVLRSVAKALQKLQDQERKLAEERRAADQAQLALLNANQINRSQALPQQPRPRNHSIRPAGSGEPSAVSRPRLL